MQLVHSATANRGREENKKLLTTNSGCTLHIADVLGFITGGIRTDRWDFVDVSVLKMFVVLGFFCSSAARCLRLVILVFSDTKWPIRAEAWVRLGQRVPDPRKLHL